MPEWIEFHDSTLESVRATQSDTTLQLDANVHRWERSANGWKGSGWSQPVTIHIDGPAEHCEVGAPVTITDGCLTVDGIPHRNWLSLPFIRGGRLTLWFDVMWTGARVQFSGEGVRVESSGAATYVGALADDMLPNELNTLTSDPQ